MRAEQLPTLRARLARRVFVLSLATLLLALLVGGVIGDALVETDVERAAEAYLSIIVAELQVSDGPTDDNVIAPLQYAGPTRRGQIIDLNSGEVAASTAGVTDPLVDPVTIGEQTTTLKATPVASSEPVVVAMRSVEVNGSSYGVVAAIDLPVGVLDFTYATVAGSLIAIVAAGGVGAAVWYSLGVAMRPVEEVSERAEMISRDPAGTSWALDSKPDTDELDRLVRRLNSLLSRIRDSQEREREFLENASHDLRTPIAVARAELELANAGSGDPQISAALASAIEELDRLDRLTGDLLILAKMRAEPAPATVPVRLGELLRKTAARLVREPDRSDVKITVEGVAEVSGDPLMLERAVENVLNNALRYASALVAVEISGSENLATVRIRDDGPGFGPEILAGAVDRFTRDRSHEDRTGLGLAIASAIAVAHGGSLQLRNRPEGGAEVTLRLPKAGRVGVIDQ